ncbi:MAG: DUF2240 family protein [Candidatus Thermoplasmatota archaeon]|nr:DUF2240 family protein [Candidatus Thermoplasmatota archaeon]
MDELQMTIALLFKRAGKQALSENEMRFALSMDLKWFAPSEARAIVDCAAKTGILAKTPEGLKPAFDIASIEIPLGFRPGKSVLECAMPPRNIFKEIAEFTCAKLGVDESAIVSEINKEIEAFGGLLDPRAAAVIVAEKHGIDAKKYAEDVENLILKNSA